MPKDLRSFLSDAEDASELLRVKREVRPRFQASAVLARLEAEGKYPAVLFERVKGHRYPVLSNAFASLRRLSMALEVEERDLLQGYIGLINRPRKPKEAPEAPVKERVLVGKKADLRELPILTHHEKDGGPYITGGVAVVRDPEEGFINCGIYRMMLKGGTKLGIQFANTSHAYYILRRSEELGKPLPVAVVVGHHPAFYIGAVAMNQFGTDEYSQIGGFLREPLAVTQGTAVDLPIPAYAEIVIEGEIPPNVREKEGPLGEYSGIYGPCYNEPIINVKAVSMRRDAVYQDIFVGHPDNLLLGMTARLNILYQTVKTACPGVKDIHMPLAGRCRFICYIALQKRVEGEAKNALMAAFAADPFLKYAVAVDPDVDIRNDTQVLHAIATRTRAGEDIFMVSNAKGSQLDPTAVDGRVPKVGIDATRRKGAYEEIRVPGVAEIRLEDFIDGDR